MRHELLPAKPGDVGLLKRFYLSVGVQLQKLGGFVGLAHLERRHLDLCAYILCSDKRLPGILIVGIGVELETCHYACRFVLC